MELCRKLMVYKTGVFVLARLAPIFSFLDTLACAIVRGVIALLINIITASAEDQILLAISPIMAAVYPLLLVDNLRCDSLCLSSDFPEFLFSPCCVFSSLGRDSMVLVMTTHPSCNARKNARSDPMQPAHPARRIAKWILRPSERIAATVRRLQLQAQQAALDRARGRRLARCPLHLT